MSLLVLSVAKQCAAEDQVVSEKYQGLVCASCENPLTIRGGKLYAMGNHKLLVDSADLADRNADVPADVRAETVLVENLVIADQVIGLDFHDLRTKQRRMGYIAIDSDGDVRMVAENKDAARFRFTQTKEKSETNAGEVEVTRFICEWLDQGKPSGKYLAAAENLSPIVVQNRDLGAQKFALADQKQATPLVGYRYLAPK
jgi:hypothetical protein